MFRGQTTLGKGRRKAVSRDLHPGKNFVVTTAGSVDERVQDETADKQQQKQDRTRFLIDLPHENSSSPVDDLSVI